MKNTLNSITFVNIIQNNFTYFLNVFIKKCANNSLKRKNLEKCSEFFGKIGIKDGRLVWGSLT